MTPSRDQALQFALMLGAGAPPSEAIRYFLAEDAESFQSQTALGQITKNWLDNKVVQAAIKELQGREWTDLTFDEKLSLATKKTYTEMAYFLYTRNVAELTGAELAKADGFRKALEAKLAGTAGQLSELERFWSDLQQGRIKLGVQPGGPEAQTRRREETSLGQA